MSTGKKPTNAGHANLRRGGTHRGPSKITASAKEAFSLAFHGLGGATALQAWAKENTTEFYKLFARLIPTEVSGEGGGPVSIRVVFEELKP